MNDVQDIRDRFRIEALRGESTDAVMMHDYERLASLFTKDGVVRIPHINAEAIGRVHVRTGAERLQSRLDYMVQDTHRGRHGVRPSIHLRRGRRRSASARRPCEDRTWRCGAECGGASAAARQRRCGTRIAPAAPRRRPRSR